MQDTARKAKRTLDELGVKLFTVKTNAAYIWDIHWGQYCGLALASTLNNFSLYANTGLISSGESYDSLVPGWGSHPMTDHLFSSDNFFIKHDGAGFNRIEKLRVLSRDPQLLDSLQFCYMVQHKDHNCGVCEKCLRTRLNLLIAGIDESQYFDKLLNKKLIKNLKIDGPAARSEWLTIYKEMLNQNIITDYAPLVKRAISKSNKPKLSFLLPLGSKRRSIAKKVVNSVVGK